MLTYAYISIHIQTHACLLYTYLNEYFHIAYIHMCTYMDTYITRWIHTYVYINMCIHLHTYNVCMHAYM